MKIGNIRNWPSEKARAKGKARRLNDICLGLIKIIEENLSDDELASFLKNNNLPNKRLFTQIKTAQAEKGE